MSFRELLIELRVKADAAAAEQLNRTLDGTTARVSSLDAGLAGVGGTTSKATREARDAFQSLLNQGFGSDMAASLREPVAALVEIRQQASAFAPLLASARDVARGVAEQLVSLRGALLANVVAPLRSVAASAFGPLVARANGAVASTVAALQRVRTALQASIAGPAQRVALAFQPIAQAALRVRAAVAPMLEPLVAAAARTRAVMGTWGAGVATVVRSTASALRDSISTAASHSISTVQTWLARVRTAAQSAAASMRSAARQRMGGGGTEGAASAPRAGGGGAGAGMLAGAVGGAVVGAAMAGAAALRQYASSALETAGAVADLRASTGLSAKEIQTWIPIFAESGASAGDFKMGLKQLSKEVADAAAGSKSAQQHIAGLGLDYRKLAEQPLEQSFNDVAKALANTTDVAARGQLAMDVFGDRAGPNLVGALAEGGAALDAQRAKFGSMSMMSDEQIAKLDALGDKMAETKLKLGMAGAQIMAAFEPLITTLLPLIEPIVQAITPIVQVLANALKPAIEQLAPLMTDTMSQMKPIWDELGPVITELAGQFVSALVPAFKQLLPIQVQLMKAIMPLIPVLGEALIGALVALMPAILQVAQALVPLVQQLVPVLIPLVESLSAIVVALANALSGALAMALPVVSRLLAGVINNVNVALRAFQFLWALISGGPKEVAAAADQLDAALGAWVDNFMAFGDTIANFFAALWSKLKSGAIAFVEGAKNVLTLGLGGDSTALDIAQTVKHLAPDGDATTLSAALTRGAGGPARLPAGSAPVASTKNVNVTQGNINPVFNITAPSPQEAARQTASYLPALQQRDTSRIFAEVAG